ncbi:MAG: hypothetical protein H6917_09275 [Novosphingobium sp.]|nr:hypothetical protein [Novosphingobium sp.]MCP5402566.1 hypothetical protein [Novosphingobium sp.]
MGRLANQVRADRAIRDAARGAFETRMSQVRQDLEARGIAGRVADRLGAEARDAMNVAMEVAEQNKGVVAGTVAALALWFLRNPIIAWLEGLLGQEAETDEQGDSQSE